jgi:hypothetical protein
MLTYDEKTGSVSELTASGEKRFNRREASELFELLDIARKNGGSPRTVMEWLNASAKPRALEDVLGGELKARGFDHTCSMCLVGAPARRFSVARARREYGVSASRPTLRVHRLHARRQRPLQPGTVKKHGGLPARGARLDGDPRAGEPDYLGDDLASRSRASPRDNASTTSHV